MSATLKQQCLAAAAKHLPTLEAVAQEITYKPAGILPSEMALYCSLMTEQGIDIVIESGRRNGYSTEFLASWAESHLCRVMSVELSPQAEVDKRLHDNWSHILSCFTGDGTQIVAELVKEYAVDRGHRVAVLLDGPKGPAAYAVWESVKDQVAFGAIHDASRRIELGSGRGTAPNPARDLFAAGGAWFTDDPEYLAMAAPMDESAWRGEYESRSELTAVGYTLAVFQGGKWWGEA